MVLLILEYWIRRKRETKMLDLDRKQDITGDIVFLLQENREKLSYLLMGRGLAVAGQGSGTIITLYILSVILSYHGLK